MKLIRKWHPASAPVISNPLGAAPYRVIAIVKDDVFTHYVCFYDMYTGKVYVEIAGIKHSGEPLTNSSLRQIVDDQEAANVLSFLQQDDVQVLQMVEEGFSVDKATKKLTIHSGLSNLPRVPYGVDSNGSQIITRDTPIEAQMSPSLFNADGSLMD